MNMICALCDRPYDRTYNSNKYCLECKDSPLRAKDRKLKHLYGLTLKQFNAMIEAQQGVCACCGEVPQETVRSNQTNTSGWSVDHDHACCPGKVSCGKCVRALLCDPCNRALGVINESPVKAAGLVSYILKQIQLGKHPLPISES